MKILHVISTMDPAAGGPAEGVRLLLSFKLEGHSGEVVTFDPPDAPYLRSLPFPVHALGPVKSNYGYTSRLYPWLRAHRDRYDGFVVNGLWQYCGLATMLALRGSAPYMVFPHGMLDPYFKRAYPIKHLKKAAYWYPAEYWVLRNAYRVLFTTETERILAEQTFPLWSWKSHIVPYGIEDREVDPLSDIAEFHNAVPALQGKRFLLYLGRIHQKKGCDLLLKAFAELADADPGLHLLMAGPDQQGWQQELNRIVVDAGVADRVHWPGILRDGPKWGAFYASEAFILPSHQENFGIAVAEALACGKPVLLSDQVNIGSMLQGLGCALIEPDTLGGTRNLIRRWIATAPHERNAMSQAATHTFRTRLDMHENAYAIIRLFQAALETGYDRPSHQPGSTA